jgi:hypothetical protein
MRINILLLLWVYNSYQLSAQTTPRPVGNFIAFGACTQTYFQKNTISDALLGLPQSGIFYELSGDFFQQKHWGFFGVLRWGQAADKDEVPMQQFIEKKYPGGLVTAPRRNPDPAKMRQFLIGIRIKFGTNRLQFQPGIALGSTISSFYAFYASIKTPNSNQLFITETAFKGVDYSKNNLFTVQLSEDLFFRLSEKHIWLKATGALLMVSLPYNTIEFKTTNELNQETSLESINSSKFRFSWSISLGLVYKNWD